MLCFLLCFILAVEAHHQFVLLKRRYENFKNYNQSRWISGVPPAPYRRPFSLANKMTFLDDSMCRRIRYNVKFH